MAIIVKAKNQKLSKKKKRRRLVLYFLMILVLLLLASVCTYAWFGLTKTPRVSNLSIYINTDPGLEISLDPNPAEWKTQITYEEMFGADYKLLPATWSEKDQRFYGAIYSFDGRRIDKWEPLTDERNANTQSRDNYYIKGTFYARAGMKMDVSLADAGAGDVDMTTASGTYLIPSPIWNSEEIRHDNGGKGAECAVRIGLRITRLNEDLTAADEEPLFYIYEPNANIHLNVPGFEYINTPSIDGMDHLISENCIIKQNFSMWNETDPVRKDLLTYFFGDFTSDTFLLSMEENEIVKIDMYIWLEGQDVDCTNAIESGQLLGNLQFEAITVPDTGLNPLPKEDES